ncbi:hypothetical protein B0H16DRAFT_1724553 [Mycena metata]|uniref:Uncharacterized protein n=1 Tax=Mycena metata TaxID=1033252 RepID=A0AAD7N8U8_9AGAR|nr:hypothetical protein B0H16DRAFT_1724553 [Mycena metata]
MANGDRKKGPKATKLTDEDKRAKRRQWAAEHRKRPEVLEKQRLLMAQRRATVKAKRRQWDPPKTVTEPARPHSVSSASSAGPDHQPDDHPIGVDAPNISLTESEQFALHTLLELARTTPRMEFLLRTSDLDNEDRSADSGIDLPLGWGSVDSSCVPTCLRAVFVVKLISCLITGRNPYNLSIHLLKRWRKNPSTDARETGRTRSPRSCLSTLDPPTLFNGKRNMQILAAALGDPFDGNASELEHTEPERIPEPALSRQRRDRILEWRETRFENDWDVASRRSFAEAALSRLYCG